MTDQKIQTFPDVVCPFCGLLCDDLSLQNEGNSFHIDSLDCPLSKSNFLKASKRTALKPRVNGKFVTRKTAVQAAVNLISNAKLPLITGLMTDVAGTRSALNLAEYLHATIDQYSNRAFEINASHIQTNGGYFTTLSEARNRADMLVLIGSQIPNLFPRLIEKLGFSKSDKFQFKRPRKIAVIGEPCEEFTTILEQAEVSASIECELKQAGHVISVIQNQLEKRKDRVPLTHSFPSSAIQSFVQDLKQSDYAVFVWAAEELSFPLGDLVVDSIFRLIDVINQSRRAAGLMLTTTPSTPTANAVSTWRYGKPLPLSFRSGNPEHHPDYYAWDSIMNREDTDLVIWVGGLDQSVEMPDCSMQKILLSNKDYEDADVFIPIAIPGLDHDSHLFRTDLTLAHYLKNLHMNDGYSGADTLEQIYSQLKC